MGIATRIALAFTVALAGRVAPARATDDDVINPDRPGIADGSAVVGRGRFQVETALQVERREDDGTREGTLFFPTLLRLGIGEHWEARVESNTYTRVRASEAGREVARIDGYSPVSIGVKGQFQESKGARHPSLGAILRVFPPSGSREFKTRHATGDLRLAGDWDLAPKWSLNPNVGVARLEDDSVTFTAALLALTLTYSPFKAGNVFLDGALQAPEMSHGRTAAVYDVGAVVFVGRNVQLDISVGAGASGSTPPHPFWAVGFSRRF